MQPRIILCHALRLSWRSLLLYLDFSIEKFVKNSWSRDLFASFDLFSNPYTRFPFKNVNPNSFAMDSSVIMILCPITSETMWKSSQLAFYKNLSPALYRQDHEAFKNSFPSLEILILILSHTHLQQDCQNQPLTH